MALALALAFTLALALALAFDFKESFDMLCLNPQLCEQSKIQSQEPIMDTRVATRVSIIGCSPLPFFLLLLSRLRLLLLCLALAVAGAVAVAVALTVALALALALALAMALHSFALRFALLCLVSQLARQN